MQFDLDFPRAFPLLGASAGFRVEPEDFFVDEQLGFNLSGHGEHLCLHVEKRGQNTVWVARQLAEMAGIRQMDVGYCGLKDRHAVTRQWFSLYLGQRELDPRSIRLESCSVMSVSRHDRKLRPGMHAGNAFIIRLRNLQGDIAVIEQRWHDITANGVPNYFGEQRFGHDGSNLQRAEELLGEHARVWRERRNQFAVSAARSWLFNRVLAGRVLDGTWCHLLPGEPQPVPTGPLWGRGRSTCRDKLLEYESGLLAPYAALCEKLEHVGLQQERRSLLLQPAACSATREGDDWVVRFSLPPGTYATAVLREVLALVKPEYHNL